MRVIEKTQSIVKGANNVKKQTAKQPIKLLFFRKAQVGGRRQVLRSVIISMHSAFFLPLFLMVGWL